LERLFVEKKHRQFEVFGRVFIGDAEIGFWRKQLLTARVDRSCMLQCAYSDPVEFFWIVYLKKSFRQASGKVLCGWYLPVERHFALLSQSHRQLASSNVFGPANVPYY
jgi:hypothetical protein